jgi:serine/threonine-protein kinase
MSDLSRNVVVLREERLAQLVAEISDRRARGETLRREEFHATNPDLAEELNDLWDVLVAADVAGVVRGEERTSLRIEPQLRDYELIEELGRGGMGVVFRARQISLGREVAIKLLARGSLANQDELARFKTEALAAASLEHSGIVKVFEVGEESGFAFYSMQLVRGTTLADRLCQGVLPLRDAATLLAKVARAVDAAHAKGVLHRDLKPANILLDARGEPHVSDFGLAKRFNVEEESLTKTGMTVGTPLYMSPEQAAGQRGNQVGPASDVYSLGAILYHALVGQAPLTGKSPVEVLQKVIEQEPIRPRSIRTAIDRDLEMIVIRCLQKPADLRYATAGELANDLEAYLKDEPVAARSGHFWQVISRVFRDTHHAPVLEHWGLLWMWHAVVLLIACTLTWWMRLQNVDSRLAYAGVWTLGLSMWAAVFWALRRRQGPVTFVERQIAHVWGSSMLGITMLFPLEWWLGLPVLALAPLVSVHLAIVFLLKGAILSGVFYGQCVALLITAVLMAYFPSVAHLIFGVIAAGCFWVPGWKYYRPAIGESGAEHASGQESTPAI